MKDFFVSFNKADRVWAGWIAWQLEGAGYSVVLQTWDFRPGSNFVVEMHKAATESHRTIAVLSTNYLDALFTQPEWAAALVRDPTGKERLLVPVRVMDFHPWGLFAALMYLDLVELDEQEAQDILLSGVSDERAKPTTPPLFPGSGARVSLDRPRFPGTLPPIWNIPHLRNSIFTGREDLLEGLHTALTSGEVTDLTQPQAIHGLGGIGKTQIAVEYSYQHAAEYDIVWWVRAEAPAVLASDYAALAHQLGFAIYESRDQSQIVEMVRRWLEQSGKWLLIFDSAPDLASVRDYLPRGGTGHVLITSRDATRWIGGAHPLFVEKWEINEAIAFLLKRTTQTDEVSAAELAEGLGRLPLALAQAGAYIDEAVIPIDKYTELFRTRRPQILSHGKQLDYPDTVATTWDISFDRIKEASFGAADLLNLCAFFAPDDIPRELLMSGAGNMPEPLAAIVADPIALDQTVALVRRYSLMEAGYTTLSMHRLVQAVVRDKLGDEAGSWAKVAITMLDRAMPRNIEDVQSWPQCERLLPHVLTVQDWIDAFALQPSLMHLLVACASMYLQEQGQFGTARSIAERVVESSRKAYGGDTAGALQLMSVLGLTLQDMGEYDKACECLGEALRLADTTNQVDSEILLTILNNYARALEAIQRFDYAEAIFKRCLDMHELLYGSDHRHTASAVNNYGHFLVTRGDLDGAIEQFERAVRIARATSKDATRDRALERSLNNLGMALREKGDLPRARLCLEESLDICLRIFGEGNFNVVRARVNLGTVLHALGELVTARALMEEALVTVQLHAEWTPTRLSVCLHSLSTILLAQYSRDRANMSPDEARLLIDRARLLVEQALNIDETQPYPNHRAILNDLSCLGCILSTQQAPREARPVLTRAIELSLDLFGPDNLGLSRCW